MELALRSMRGHLARGGTVEDVIEQTARDLRAAFTLTGLRLEVEPVGEPGQEATA